MERKNILTGSPWEDKMGYCRAVRIGNIIEVSGTVAIVDGEKVKTAIQTKQYDQKINAQLQEGENIGVNSTPTFYVNNEKQAGALNTDQWKELLDKKLAE